MREELATTQVTLEVVSDGEGGKSAYESFLDGLPSGVIPPTEQEFNTDLADVPNKANSYDVYDKTTADGLIEEASLVADNYIDADSTGIEVHNEGDTDNYVRIDTNGMKIFQNGNEISSFGSNSIALGEGGNNSSIVMNDRSFCITNSYNETHQTTTIRPEDGDIKYREIRISTHQSDLGRENAITLKDSDYFNNKCYTEILSKDGSFNACSLRVYALEKGVVIEQFYDGEVISGPVPFLVESGTKNGWHYRVWSDGRRECWTKLSVSATLNTSNGGWYSNGTSGAATPDFPTLDNGTNLFTEEPMKFISAENISSTARNVLAGIYYGNVDHVTNFGNYVLFRGNSLSGSNNYNVYMRAIQFDDNILYTYDHPNGYSI